MAEHIKTTVAALLAAIQSLPDAESRWARAEQAADRQGRGVTDAVMLHADRGADRQFLAEIESMYLAERQPWRERADVLAAERDALRGSIRTMVSLVTNDPTVIACNAATIHLFNLVDAFHPDRIIGDDRESVSLVRCACSLLMELIPKLVSVRAENGDGDQQLKPAEFARLSGMHRGTVSRMKEPLTVTNALAKAAERKRIKAKTSGQIGAESKAIKARSAKPASKRSVLWKCPLGHSFGDEYDKCPDCGSADLKLVTSKK